MRKAERFKEEEEDDRDEVKGELLKGLTERKLELVEEGGELETEEDGKQRKIIPLDFVKIC